MVVPYSPDESRVVNMLRARDAPRMPPDRPLSESDIRLVEAWIANGARRHEGDQPPVDARDAPISDAGLSDVAGADALADAAQGN
jgi:hypothetical protein